METGHGSIIFWDPEEATWREGNRGCLVDKLRDDCEYRLTNNCGGGGGGIRLYCSDDLNIISRSRLIAMVLWLLLNIFPQLLLASFIFIAAQPKGFLHTLLYFPQLLISPPITNITCAPWPTRAKNTPQVKMQPWLCWANVCLSVLGQLASLYILFVHFSRADPNKNPTLGFFGP